MTTGREAMKRLTVLLPVLLAFLVGAVPALAWTWPADGPVLQQFNYGGNSYAGGQHRGVDIGAATGAPVSAPSGGIVTFAGSVPHGGLSVTIRTRDGYAVTLVHLGALLVSKGDVVGEGAAVGTVGPSGDPELAEPYLHLGVRLASDTNGYLDPLALLPAQTPGTALSGGAPVEEEDGAAVVAAADAGLATDEAVSEPAVAGSESGGKAALPPSEAGGGSDAEAVAGQGSESILGVPASGEGRVAGVDPPPPPAATAAGPPVSGLAPAPGEVEPSRGVAREPLPTEVTTGTAAGSTQPDAKATLASGRSAPVAAGRPPAHRRGHDARGARRSGEPWSRRRSMSERVAEYAQPADVRPNTAVSKGRSSEPLPGRRGMSLETALLGLALAVVAALAARRALAANERTEGSLPGRVVASDPPPEPAGRVAPGRTVALTVERTLARAAEPVRRQRGGARRGLPGLLTPSCRAGDARARLRRRSTGGRCDSRRLERAKASV
jgi:hypothetical protein